jgi:aspartate aminotransferase
MASTLTRITARAVRTTARTTARSLTSTPSASSPWSGVPEGPPDAILGLNSLFAADEDQRKISVGVGAYRGADGKPFVLPSVKEAERILIAQNLNREYLPITGLATFNELACDMIYGKDRDIPLAKTQVLSGTGGLRIGGEFLKSFGNVEEIYMPNPTWGNHGAIFKRCGLTPKTYRYLDFDGENIFFFYYL